MKTCRNKECKQSNPQPLDCFAKKPRYKDGIYSQCNSCVNYKAAISRVKNPESINETYS